MGGAVASLPDRLSEDELKNICGDRFDQAVYDSLKEEDGFVDKSKFLEASGLGTAPAGASGATPHEAEARNVFAAYCEKTHGVMESKTFNKLCKDLKFLNKKFTSGAADLVYTKSKGKHPSITFEIFRDEILVEMALKKECTVEQLVNKIALSDGPVLHGTVADKVKFHDDTSTYTGAIAQNGNFKNDVSAAGDEENKAALKLQNVQRVKQAKAHVENLKDVCVLYNHYTYSDILYP